MGERVGIGLLGLGVVGTGVARALTDKAEVIGRRVGRPIELRSVLVRDTDRPRELPGLRLTTNAADVIDDPTVDIVVEVLGGEDPAHEYILRALRAGKHVVTANKEVIAKHGPEIVAAADAAGVDIAYEAAVGGGIPVIGPFKLDLLANDITRVTAIINGTTNYIITRMSQAGLDFDTALREAQHAGYAEPDPRNDIEGVDAAYKLAILASLAFHARVHPDAVYRAGITGLSPADFRYARELGYSIKLLAIGKSGPNGIELRVHPAMLPAGAMLASVDGVFNAVQVYGDLVGTILFYGRGAGAGPTSSAVVADIIDLAGRLPAEGRVRGPQIEYADRALLSMDHVRTRYYVRLIAADQPGVIANVARAFGDHAISLSSVIQKEEVQSETDGPLAEIVFMTHEAAEAPLQEALREIRTLSTVARIGSLIRVEG
ncbi:MAG: homoserine dehydrogenase [Chloroflexi bacterium]|nr:homoserine dehydrogenase [Chloroflexota bacterium]